MEHTDKRSNSETVALISGAGNSLAQALIAKLGALGVRLYLADHAARTSALAETETLARESGAVVLGSCCTADDAPGEAALQAHRATGRLDYFVDFCVPTSDWTFEEFTAYPAQLLQRALIVAEYLIASPGKGNAVLHCFLPSMYADSKFDTAFPMVKGAIVGVNRTICRRFGKAGLVINCVQTGLVDMPETKAVAKERVLGVVPPLGRWATPLDVAQTIAFLLLNKGYLTGQCLVFDGGLTSGITGT